MSVSPRTARAVLAVCVAVLAAYAVIWVRVSPVEIGRSDFTSFYVGGTLLREGHAAGLYDEHLQTALHSRLIAPDREGNLPFVDTPVAAVLVLPVTLLPLDAAYRLWQLLELGALVLAVVVAVRAAPWPAGSTRLTRVAAGAAALAGAGTLVVVAQAQWTPLAALGLAVAYSCWRGDRRALGAAALVASAAIAKPHLALGLLAFMLGWRDRRVIVGAVAGAAGIALASLAIVGSSGVAGFLGIVAGSTVRWDLRLMLSVSGLAGSYLGNGAAAHAAATAGTVLACGAACWLGARARRPPEHLDLCLAGAAVLSLLAAPHAYLHDLVLLAPVAAWSLALQPQTERTSWRWPGVVLGLWTLVNAAAVIDLADQAAFPPGQLTAWALIAAAVVAGAGVRGAGPSAFRYRARREAAVGAMAHDVRGG